MAEEARRRKLPLWLRIVLGVVVAIFALVAAGVALRYWITSDAGRAFITSQIDGRKAGPLGTIRISGLKGDPLGSATVADIALVDDEGVWLRAKDARLEWTPTALFAGELEISKINVRTVDVLRQPLLSAQQDEGAPPDIGLSLDEVSIDDLRLAKAVIGVDARYAIKGGASRLRDASGNARLTLTPVSGPADRADIAAEWSATNALKGAASLNGPAGGLIASLIQAPEGKSVAFDGRVDGTIEHFTGSARLAFNDEQAALVSISRDNAAARMTADIATDRWPLLAPFTERAGANAKLEGKANLADLKNAPVELQLLTKAGTVDVGVGMNFETWAPKGPFDIRATQLDLALVAPPLAGKIDATGQLAITGIGNFEWKGSATAARIAWPSGGATRISAPLTIAKDGLTISWATPSAVIEGGRVDALRSLAPARYTGSTRGEFNLKTQVVEIYQSQLIGAPGDASARGTYRISTGVMDFQGTAHFNRLADVAPLSGSARSLWSVRQNGHNAPIRITADAQGRDVSSSIASLAELAGPEPRVVLAGVVQSGRFVIESGSIHGAGVRADMTGRVNDAGRITGSANGVLVRPLGLPGATIEDLAFSADVTGSVQAPHVDLRLSDGAVSAAGLAFTNVAGRGQATIGRAISGDFALSGKSGTQDLNLSGRILGGEGDLRIADLVATLGKLQVKAPRLAFSDGVFSTTFSATGPLAGIGGLERGTLTANGTISAGDDLVVDVTGRLADVRSGAMRIDLLTFDADAKGGAAKLQAQARGVVGAPIDLKLTASGTQSGDAWSGQASVQGAIDQLPVATTRPAAWRYASDAWSVDTELSAFDGKLDAVLASSANAASAKLDLQGLNIRALSRLARVTPINGQITGSLTFANGPGSATGDFRLAVANANPVGVTADPVSLTMSGQLREGVLTASVSGEGQGFKLAASSREQMIVGLGFDVRPDMNAPLQAQLDMTGRAEQLWALFGPEDQSLRGQLQAQVRAVGTIAKPDLSGGFTVASGAYEHGETGVQLREITARGDFDENSLRLTGVSANDGHGGRISGEGAIRWEHDLSGGLNFVADNLRALGRDDRMAVVSGKGAIELGEDATSITGDFNVSQARISVEQPASASIPTIAGVRRVNFPNQTAEAETAKPWLKPVLLDVKVSANNRITVFGRGLETEWSGNLHITGPIADPSIEGTATLVRGDLDLAGRRFAFDTGTIDLDGPIRLARIDISAERAATDVTASVHITGTPVEPKFTLESTPALPQDEILARVLFGRSAAELSGFEAAQLAAGLAQLAGGQAGFDPVGLVRKATGLDRVSFGAEDGIATVSAGKYIAEDVYLQVGAGGQGGVGAEVEWEPQKNLSVTSSADGNGDTKIAIRWKKDY
ncbi:MAG: translocation/assembly module TamB domain-containing protein [Hyphomonadaceae bacterium]